MRSGRSKSTRNGNTQSHSTLGKRAQFRRGTWSDRSHWDSRDPQRIFTLRRECDVKQKLGLVLKKKKKKNVLFCLSKLAIKRDTFFKWKVNITLADFGLEDDLLFLRVDALSAVDQWIHT